MEFAVLVADAPEGTPPVPMEEALKESEHIASLERRILALEKQLDTAMLLFRSTVGVS